MPRPLLDHAGPRATVSPPTTPATAPTTGLGGPALQRRLRQARSQRYCDAMNRLDAGTHHQDRTGLEELIAAIAAEFPELTVDQRPLGLVSRCHLGPPYDVHICDLAGSIIEHFETSRSMPDTYERARQLARHGRYAFVEIYADHVCAVSADGTAAVIDL